MGKLDGKIAIVTGAGQGIGRGIAEKLAAEGATVAVTDVNEATAKETAEAIGGVGHRAPTSRRARTSRPWWRRCAASSAGSTCS